ncbi:MULTISPECIES: efflux RND transporter periplasmic adaptor subunit [Brucella]|uniref:efflux RND transporter periplasmic adaptor subunit n=1 Tax=Brucella TaxID=234 RepID=UPI0002CFB1AE|nr:MULTISPECIES: efflux RND transporter periplasmic adaptor subunit [Brucella]AOG53275.1 efflux transporter periplasmic adaptor subunit [Brucella melitensis]ARY12479.1 efflux transporter periplasmic adaptor subunit [Brucella melitensis]ARY18805.1 efflux transporter periplasmic adaptor subunit [Brucella melitensis]ARY22012.1 efflux transporter periplasmic adaptor subunit [Brucella melitensis]ARY31485.1 efflux transporter periplasmic adaptor subunit [Brucella melitensis]
MLKSSDSSQLGQQPASARKRAKGKRRWWLWLSAAAIIIGAGWYFYGSYKADGEKSSYLAETVTRGDIENAITAVGTLSALRSVNVGAQVSGQLKSVKVEVGDHVKQGQLIAEIDPSPFEKKVEIAGAQLDNLKAQLLSKDAQLTLKKLNAARQKSLLATRGVSQTTVDQANADLLMAEAEVKALNAQIRQQEAQLASDKVDLGYTSIYSPMEGTVVDEAAKEGETLNAVQSAPTIVTVADLKVMTVEAQVSEADISKLKPGMPVYFTLLGQPDKRFTGTLRQIKPTPATDNNVVLYYALFDVPNPTGELMIDMSAQVYFVLGEAKDVLVVPTAALTDKQKGGKPQVTVKVADESGTLVERPVKVGVRNRVLAEIQSGLEEGDRVVVTAATGNGAAGGERGRRPSMRFF